VGGGAESAGHSSSPRGSREEGQGEDFSATPRCTEGLQSSSSPSVIGSNPKIEGADAPPVTGCPDATLVLGRGRSPGRRRRRPLGRRDVEDGADAQEEAAEDGPQLWDQIELHHLTQVGVVAGGVGLELEAERGNTSWRHDVNRAVKPKELQRRSHRGERHFAQS